MDDQRKRAKLHRKYSPTAGEVAFHYPEARIGGGPGAWSIDLRNCRAANDDAMRLCAKVEHLLELLIGPSRLSEAGLSQLHAVPTLKRVVLEKTRAPVSAVDALREALPRAEILWTEPEAVGIGSDKPSRSGSAPPTRAPALILDFEAPEVDHVRYFIVGSRPVMLIEDEGRMWSDSFDWQTGGFTLDMDYLTRVSAGVDVEVDAVDLDAFGRQVSALRAKSPLVSLAGRDALLWKGGWSLHHVRLDELTLWNQGFAATARPLGTPGLVNDPRLYDIPLGAYWSKFRMEGDNWMETELRWQLFFERDVLDRVFEIVGRLPVGKNYVDDTISGPRTGKFIKQSPGPIFSDLIEAMVESGNQVFGVSLRTGHEFMDR